MPNWCKCSITSFIVGFSPRATKLERSRVGSPSASRTSDTACVFGDSSGIASFDCPDHQEKTVLLAESGVDCGVAGSATTLIKEEGDNSTKARPPAAIVSAMTM